MGLVINHLLESGHQIVAAIAVNVLLWLSYWSPYKPFKPYTGYYMVVQY